MEKDELEEEPTSTPISLADVHGCSQQEILEDNLGGQSVRES